MADYMAVCVDCGGEYNVSLGHKGRHKCPERKGGRNMAKSKKNVEAHVEKYFIVDGWSNKMYSRSFVEQDDAEIAAKKWALEFVKDKDYNLGASEIKEFEVCVVQVVSRVRFNIEPTIEQC